MLVLCVEFSRAISFLIQVLFWYIYNSMMILQTDGLVSSLFHGKKRFYNSILYMTGRRHKFYGMKLQKDIYHVLLCSLQQSESFSIVSENIVNLRFH